MFKRLAFSALATAMLFSIGSGAALANETSKPISSTTKVQQKAIAGSASMTINWTSLPNYWVDHYKISIRDIETNEVILDQYQVSKYTGSYHTPGLAGHRHRVWVAAFDNLGNKLAEGIQEPYLYNNSQTNVFVTLR